MVAFSSLLNNFRAKTGILKCEVAGWWWFLVLSPNLRSKPMQVSTKFYVLKNVNEKQEPENTLKTLTLIRSHFSPNNSLKVCTRDVKLCGFGQNSNVCFPSS